MKNPFTKTLIRTGLVNEVRKFFLEDIESDTTYPRMEMKIITNTNSILFRTIPLLPNIFVFGNVVRLLYINGKIVSGKREIRINSMFNFWGILKNCDYRLFFSF